MELEEFRMEDTGEIIKPGSLILPPGFVSSFPPYAGDPETPLYDDKDIASLISNPNRRDIVKLLPFAKYGNNQGPYSSCNGHAAANGLTYTRLLTGIDDGLVLSGTYVYSLINDNRDNGSHLERGLQAISKYGAPSRTTVPYNRIYRNQYNTRVADAEAKKNIGLQAYRCKTKQAWRSALAAGWMGIAAIHADSRVINYRGTGIAPLANGPGNHAILISDMRIHRGTEVYLEDNSWGIGWGNLGRAWLTWDHFAQTFNNHAFYVIPGVQVQK